MRNLSQSNKIIYTFLISYHPTHVHQLYLSSAAAYITHSCCRVLFLSFSLFFIITHNKIDNVENCTSRMRDRLADTYTLEVS